MSTELAERPVAAPTVTQDQMALVKQTIANGATDAELKLYLYDCARHGVHPLDRLLHFTKRGGKYTPVTSIDLMRTRAADTGDYAGSDDAVFSGTRGSDEFAASVTVWRMVQGQRCPFAATARWSEYKPDSAHMWQRMPHTMLAKCAEALALRKGFPRQLAGVYAAEEMAQADRGHRTDSTHELAVPRAMRPHGYDAFVQAIDAAAALGVDEMRRAFAAGTSLQRDYLSNIDEDTLTKLRDKAHAVARTENELLEPMGYTGGGR